MVASKRNKLIYNNNIMMIPPRILPKDGKEARHEEVIRVKLQREQRSLCGPPCA